MMMKKSMNQAVNSFLHPLIALAALSGEKMIYLKNELFYLNI